MSTTVDNRVVEMQFDNKHFESNVQTSMSTLEKLKQSLNLKGASRGLEEINNAAAKNNFGVLGSAVETVHARFSALQVMGVTALANITNAAVNAGTQMVKSLTIAPITDGFKEYETQMGAIQTILANTKSKGSTLDDVNNALSELNHYADQTIYNFTEMTRNIGTFTAAGVDLEKSTTSIKGIANLAAVSGSTSQQASTAMYQLSQALAAGKVSLMDWNSVVNAGMGGELFQNALKRTAKQQGHDVDALIEKYGSFRESLTEGEWLTTEVLTETLTQLSGAYSEADLIAQGYTEEQAKEIVDLANTAVSAATEVKTFTQLMDTLKEAVGSGWAQTWQILFGDFEEAKALFTGISNVAGDFINNMSDARNDLLREWKELGGRTALIDGLKAGFNNLVDILSVVADAFGEVFKPITSDQLMKFTENFKSLMESAKPTAETLDQIKRIAKGVFSAFDLIRKGVQAVIEPLVKLATGEGIGGLANFLLEFVASIGDFFTSLNASAGAGKFFSGLTDGLSSLAQTVSNILDDLFGGIDSFGDAFAAVGEFIGNVAGGIGDVLANVFGWIKENIGFGSIFAALAGGGIFSAAMKVKEIFSGGILGMIFGEKDNNFNIKESIGEIFDGLGESLNAFTSAVKTTSLVSIAIAVGILAASLNTLSKIDPLALGKALLGIGALMGMLTLTFTSISKTLDLFDASGIVKAGFALILVATALNIFVSAVEKMAELPLLSIVKGLFGVGVGLGLLCAALKVIDKVKISLRTSVAIIALAEACKILGEALTIFGEMSWEKIGRGLTAMGLALAELTAVLWAMSKFGGMGSLLGSVGLLIAVQSLDEMSNALKRFGLMPWSEIGRGLVAMGGTLGIFTASLGILSKIGGFGSLLGGAAIFVVTQALDDIATALSKFGSMKWNNIGRGLAGMGGALAELATTVGVLGKIAGFSGILGSAAIVIVVEALDEIADALKKIGFLSWDTIGRGLVGMGGALAEVAVAAGALGKIAGLSGILGAGAITIVVDSLDEIANALSKFGNMSWEKIGRGLVGMGGALAEVAVITGVLGKLTGIGGLLGGGAIYIAVQDLGKLADAFKKFGQMSWDEIGRGLVGMGGALAEVAVITGALGAVAGLPALLGSGSLLLAIQGLGDLADAFKKFGDMSWDEVKNGLAAMGGALGETAIGGLLNTFSGLGSLSISVIAEPLGKLADSVKKWANVSVPEELGGQLGLLAKGVSAFNFNGWGADAIATLADPLGNLADSVSKWSTVVVPEGLGAQLQSLAPGISAFNFAGWGADAIAALAEPLGTLAGSINAWSGVTIPEGMEEKLTSLANGVKAWTWAFMGGWSIDAVVEPLKNLAGSITPWNDVKIPSGIQDGLEGLAEGVKAWTWAFMGGWSIGAVCEPLTNLADAVKSWNGVSIPDGMDTKLEGLANGVKAFADVSADNLSNQCDGIREIGQAAKDVSGIDFGGVASQLNEFATSVNNIDISADNFTDLGTNIMNNLVSAIQAGFVQIRTSMASLSVLFSTSGVQMVKQFADGISKTSGTARSAVLSMARMAASSASASTTSFYSAGYNCATGFASGIRSGSFAATIAARAMAAAAAQAAKNELDINSPSKVFEGIGQWVPAGLAKGIDKYGYYVANSIDTMATNALDNTKNVISRIGEAVSHMDVDSQPTIRPVVDLSNVESGVSAINGMFGNNFTVGAQMNLNAISTSMRRNRQNGTNDDVVSAIDRLRKDVNNIDKPSYSIGDITYSGGSDVANAIETLVNAVRVEGRA